MVNNELTSNLMLSKSKFCYTIPLSARHKELALDQGGIIDHVWTCMNATTPNISHT
jgi:hypothetical protein